MHLPLRPICASIFLRPQCSVFDRYNDCAGVCDAHEAHPRSSSRCFTSDSARPPLAALPGVCDADRHSLGHCLPCLPPLPQVRSLPNFWLLHVERYCEDPCTHSVCKGSVPFTKSSSQMNKELGERPQLSGVGVQVRRQQSSHVFMEVHNAKMQR